MNGLAVTVDFKLEPGEMAAFRKLIDENAQMSCEREPGCRRFAVPMKENVAQFDLIFEESNNKR